jgi:tape measure domain-containing protein
MADTNVQERLYRLVVDGTQAVAQLKKISKDTESIDQRFSKLGQNLRSAFAVFAAGGAVKGLVDAAQKLNALQASLNVLRGSAEKGAQAMALVNKIVADTGVTIGAAGQAFTRLSIGLQSLGATNQQIAAITEGFVKLGRVGGASIEDINESLVQFGQALSSGVLQGDEFKSISERFPLLLQQLAKDLNVSVGQLKKMGSEGKLTSDILANSFLKNLSSINEQFAKLPETFEQGMNRIQAAAARFSQTWFNSSKAGEVLSKTLNIIAEEIDSITAGSAEWKSLTDDLATSFKQVGSFVVTTIGEVKTLGLALRFLTEGAGALKDGGWAGLKELSDELDNVQIDINNTTAAQLRYMNGTQNALDLLAGSVDKYGDAIGQLKPPQIIDEKAVKAAAAELKKLQSEWDTFFNKVQTPDETFNEMSAQLDKLVAKLNPAADQVARVRAELEKVRNEANEKLRVENLTEYAKGWEGAQEAIKKTYDDAEQLRGKLELLAKLGPPESWNAGALALAQSLGTAATAADQVAVAVAKVNTEGANMVALTAEFEKLKESGRLSAEELAKVKEALGGLGETKKTIDEIGVAIGTTLSNSVGSFVDVLLDSEGDIKAFFANLLKEIGKLIIQIAILNQLKASLGGTSFGAFFGFAKGDDFGGGTGLKHGIYDKPTFFKFAKGASFGARNGVLGEAGPEAVLPLKRTASGDLGVQASPVNVAINNYTDDQVQVTESNRSDGTRDLNITIIRAVKGALTDGSLDRSLRDNFNLSRAGR